LEAKAVETKRDKNNLLQYQTELKDARVRKVELNEEAKFLRLVAEMLKDTGIKSRIIKQYVPVMNKLINHYLQKLGFFVQFELDENFNEKIKSRYRDDFSYESFSEGEKKKIDIAILMTWRTIAKMRNSISSNLLIMDEIFDSSFDANATDEFLKIIYDLTNDTNTFIISHKVDFLIDKFDNVLRFQKHGNFSTMEG
jgi:DNA repair exonuclease SbcCD ATPase subunit